MKILLVFFGSLEENCYCFSLCWDLWWKTEVWQDKVETSLGKLFHSWRFPESLKLAWIMLYFLASKTINHIVCVCNYNTHLSPLVGHAGKYAFDIHKHFFVINYVIGSVICLCNNYD